MNDPDSIVEYVRWLDKRHTNLRDAIQHHRVMKLEHSLPGSIDEFDRTLWAALEASYEGDDNG
jgi:hypothetical protein